jgi:hypothetical protein
MRSGASLVSRFLLFSALACTPPGPRWEQVLAREPAGLLSIWGASARDVWVAGADPKDGVGPYVLHFDGAGWTRLRTGESGDLWWVHGFADGPVFFAGEGGRVLRHDSGRFTRLDGPATSATLFGLWGATPDDLWAVGGGDTGRPLVWRSRGGAPFSVVEDFPRDLGAGLFKVWGRAPDDVWFAGGEGALVRWNGTEFLRISTGTSAALLTVHGSATGTVAVGGAVGGAVITQGLGAGPFALAATDAPSLSGVFVGTKSAWAVGDNGAVLLRDEDGAWVQEPTGFEGPESLHAVWSDPDGGVWAVGGRIAAAPRIAGTLIHRGAAIGAGSVTLP